jgi:hypothetical protein
MPSGSSNPSPSRKTVAGVVEAVREALARLSGLFGPRPALVPIPVRVTNPAQRRQAVLEALRQQQR